MQEHEVRPLPRLDVSKPVATNVYVFDPNVRRPAQRLRRLGDRSQRFNNEGSEPQCNTEPNEHYNERPNETHLNLFRTIERIGRSTLILPRSRHAHPISSALKRLSRK